MKSTTFNIEKDRGFTLIELVIVIVIIGILAAVALPKFSNLTTQAHTAANQGVAGGLAASTSIAHAAWIAAGASSSASTVTMDGTSVSVNGSGWPDGSGGVAPTAAQCATLFSAILNNAPLVGSTVATCTATNDACYVASAATSICTYTAYSGGAIVTGTTITYNLSTGTVTSAP